jgi:hypothetical protein
MTVRADGEAKPGSVATTVMTIVATAGKLKKPGASLRAFCFLPDFKVQDQNDGRSVLRAFCIVVRKYSSRSRSNFCWVALNFAMRVAISSRSCATHSSRLFMAHPFR